MNPPRQGKLFGKKPQPPPQPTVQLGDMVGRLRMLEERYSNLERRLQVNEQNMLSKERKINTEIKTLGSDLLELKNVVEEVKERIRMLVSELRESAKQGDVEVLKKYMSYWEPMKFVTIEEVEGTVRRILEEKEK